MPGIYFDCNQATLNPLSRTAFSEMTTAGFGESRPRETNDTIAGRARNRRVELVRDCKAP